jgi:addiction module RelE/StbE family toxin
MYRLVWTARFTRAAKKFAQAHPDLRPRLAQILRDLESDPLQPHLRLHPLKGKLQGLHAVSVTYSYRITLTLKVTKKEIILLDVGSHDEVYE